MKQKFFTLLTLLLCLCSGAWATDYHYVNTSTWDLTSNFRSALTQDGTSRTIDGNTYSKTRKFGSSVSSFGNPNDIGTKFIVYEVKTNSTSFDIYVYNTNSNAQNLYITEVAEGATDASTTTLSAPSSSGTKLTYSVKGSTNNTIYFYVGNTSLLIGDIVAKETGTALPTGGQADFSMSLNKGRSAIKSKTSTVIEGMEFYVNSNYSALSSGSAAVKNNNTDYVKFAVASPMVLKLTTNATASYTVSSTKGSSTNPITPTKDEEKSIKLTTADTYYINPQGSDIKITNIAFSAAPQVSYNANGGTGEMANTYFTVAANSFTAPDGKVFDRWNTQADGEGTNKEVGAEVETNTPLYAIWKDAPVQRIISFAAGDGSGVVPGDITEYAGTEIILPVNRTLYKEGYTMTGWDEDNDGIADYEPGAPYTISGDATLTAIYRSNGGTTLASRTVATTVRFDFQRQNGAPTVQWGEGSGAKIWVAQATVAGKTIDVKADINVTASGKFNNASWTDWVQINNTTEIAVPSVNGAVVNVYVYAESNASAVNDNARDSYASNVATYNISSSNTTALFVANAPSSAYYKYVEVVLPGPTYDVDFTLTNVTKSTGDATVEGGTQYTATFAAADGYGLPASVTVTAGGTDISSNCTWASGTLTIPAAYVTGDIAITIDGVAIAGSTIIKATMSSASSATPSGTLAGSVSASTQNGGGSPDSNGGYKFGSGGHYIGLTLATGNTFMAGDVINVHTTTASGQGTIAIYDTDKSTVLYDTGTPGVAGDNKFVLPAAVNGKSAIYVCRVNNANNWNGYVDFIEVTRPNAAITLNNVSGAAYGFSTFCSPNNFTVTGATAYKASLDKGKLTLTALEGIIPANAGVILAADKGATASIAYTTSDATADMDGNALGGTTARTLTATLKGGNTYFYAFQNTTNTFKQYTGEYFPANKAYVVSNAQLSRGISMDFGETTGISNVDVNANDNFDVNAPMYNLAGQKVGKSYKGIVIVNGKKVVRK